MPCDLDTRLVADPCEARPAVDVDYVDSSAGCDDRVAPIDLKADRGGRGCGLLLHPVAIIVNEGNFPLRIDFVERLQTGRNPINRIFGIEV